MENENKPEENSGTGEKLRIKSVDEIIADMERIASRGECASVAMPVVQNWADLLRTAIDGERNRWLDAAERAIRAQRPDASSPALATMREMLNMLDHVKELLQGPGSFPASVCQLRDDIAAAASKIASAEASRIVGGEETRT